jgi:hypothetical protein
VCVVNLPPAFSVPSTPGHDKYLRFIWPLLEILSLLPCCPAALLPCCPAALLPCGFVAVGAAMA